MNSSDTENCQDKIIDANEAAASASSVVLQPSNKADPLSEDAKEVVNNEEKKPERNETENIKASVTDYFGGLPTAAQRSKTMQVVDFPIQATLFRR